MLCSSCGSLGLEQIDRDRCTRVPIKLVFGFEGPKEFQRVPTSINFSFITEKSYESVSESFYKVVLKFCAK